MTDDEEVRLTIRVGGGLRPGTWLSQELRQHGVQHGVHKVRVENRSNVVIVARGARAPIEAAMAAWRRLFPDTAVAVKDTAVEVFESCLRLLSDIELLIRSDHQGILSAEAKLHAIGLAVGAALDSISGSRYASGHEIEQARDFIQEVAIGMHPHDDILEPSADADF